MFNMQPPRCRLPVLSCIFKNPVQPSAEPDSEQTVTELIVSFDRTLYLRVAGLLSRT